MGEGGWDQVYEDDGFSTSGLKSSDGDAIDSVRNGHRQSSYDESYPHICLQIVGTGAVERLAPLNASFSASATLYRPIQPSGNAWNHEICVVEFLEAYQLDSDRYSGNVRPIPFFDVLSFEETGNIGSIGRGGIN